MRCKQRLRVAPRRARHHKPAARQSHILRAPGRSCRAHPGLNIASGQWLRSPPPIPGVLTYHLPVAGEEPQLPDPDDAATGEAELPENLTARQRYLLRRAREEAAYAAEPGNPA